MGLRCLIHGHQWYGFYLGSEDGPPIFECARCGKTLRSELAKEWTGDQRVFARTSEVLAAMDKIREP